MSYLLQAEQYFQHQAMVFQNASKYEVVYEVVVFILNENVFFFFDVLLQKISLKNTYQR